ncbi:MAG: 3-hydroxyacyl-CoA dehydrogenase, partial [Verrucomicrobiae bacterium]|nr:3-hydroxyacyl-CoA dehydrogenase [Verrucomicrobiae bacterium]
MDTASASSRTPLKIGSAAVIGAGTMGSQIAAHLANLGFPVLLLDLPPSELTREEASRGLTLEHAEVRNRPTQVLLSKAARLSPPPFCTRAAVDRVKVGNVDDDLA